MHTSTPKFRGFCLPNKFLKVIDLHSDFADNQTDDRYLLENCLKEIKRCTQDSIGPTFLVIHLKA